MEATGNPDADPAAPSDIGDRSGRGGSNGGYDDVCCVLPQNRANLGSDTAGERNFSQPEFTRLGHRRINPLSAARSVEEGAVVSNNANWMPTCSSRETFTKIAAPGK